MAKLYDWGDGKGKVHSISLEQHKANVAAKQGTPATPSTPAPAAPTLVNPFSNAGDLESLRQFITDYEAQVANLDYSLRTQEIDTDYQRGAINKAATEGTDTTQNEMAARGLFQSSIRDAALYDIEASRALQQKFLDDKMTAAKLDAGTRKGILARSKEQFDRNFQAKTVENARAVNDEANRAWAAAMQQWLEANPAQPTTPAATPATPRVQGGTAQPTTGIGASRAERAGIRPPTSSTTPRMTQSTPRRASTTNTWS